jgi:pilus assembly protein CpaB
MARRTLLLLASILVAALGTALIWLYVQGAESRAQAGQALVSVLVLNRDVQAGTPAQTALTAATPKPVPADLATDAVTSPQQVAGLVLKDPAVQHQLLLKTMFGTSTSSGAAPSRGIITISVSDPHRVPAQLKPGDHVAVFALFGPGSRGGNGPQLVETDIAVVSIGSTMQTPTGTGSPVPVTIVGFDATPKQAAKLVGIEAAGGQAQLYLLGPGTVVEP